MLPPHQEHNKGRGYYAKSELGREGGGEVANGGRWPNEREGDKEREGWS